MAFIVRCRSCQGEIAFAPIYDRESSLLQPSGPTCLACSSPLSVASLKTQLEVQIRKCISRYYEFWTVCNDPTCALRTRGMGVYGKRCLRRLEAAEVSRSGGPGRMTETCKGLVKLEYTDVDLYNQMRYFASLDRKSVV